MGWNDGRGVSNKVKEMMDGAFFFFFGQLTGLSGGLCYVFGEGKDGTEWNGTKKQDERVGCKRRGRSKGGVDEGGDGHDGTGMTYAKREASDGIGVTVSLDWGDKHVGWCCGM